jgi:hypothetical protein
MFILDPDPTFKFRVTMWRPGEETSSTLTFIGRHKDSDQLKAWVDRAKDMEGNDAAFLLEVVDGWEGMADRDRNPVAFSKDAFVALVKKHPGSGMLIFNAYARELSAGRGKNS